MARYYEETALIEFVKKYTPHINGETTLECVERAIREAPTTDVVPKSEVDELKAIIADHKASEERLEELYSNAKADVAREIFEEIEKHSRFQTQGISPFRLVIDDNIYKEIKNKYTENQI